HHRGATTVDGNRQVLGKRHAVGMLRPTGEEQISHNGCEIRLRTVGNIQENSPAQIARSQMPAHPVFRALPLPARSAVEFDAASIPSGYDLWIAVRLGEGLADHLAHPGF